MDYSYADWDLFDFQRLMVAKREEMEAKMEMLSAFAVFYATKEKNLRKQMTRGVDDLCGQIK